MYMPTDYRCADTRCPYYITEDDFSVSCEGITQDCKIVVRFGAKHPKDQHKSLFCDARYDCCEVARMLDDKYED